MLMVGRWCVWRNGKMRMRRVGMRMRMGVRVSGLGVRRAMVVRRPLRELLLVSRHRMRVPAR